MLLLEDFYNHKCYDGKTYTFNDNGDVIIYDDDQVNLRSVNILNDITNSSSSSMSTNTRGDDQISLSNKIDASGVELPNCKLV